MSLAFDILISAIIGISSLFGLYSGFIRLSIGLVSFAASILAAYFLYPVMEGFFVKHISHEVILTVTSATVAYIISLSIFAFISSKFLNMVKNSSGGVFDRFLGLVAGFIRGGTISLMLFLSIIIIISGVYIDAENAADLKAAMAKEKYPDWLNEAKATGYLHEASFSLISKIPEEKLKNITFSKEPPEEDL